MYFNLEFFILCCYVKIVSLGDKIKKNLFDTKKINTKI